MPSPFVGRRGELSTARRAVADVAEGRGSVLVLAGEAGIGKSSLAREIAGAVISLARNEARARAFLRRAIELDAEVRVPVAVLAETLRGTPRDAGVHRLLNAVSDSVLINEAIGRRAGALLGRADRSNTVDAIIVAEAIESGGAEILTGDPDDLTALAEGEHSVTIHAL